jgi:tRNA pseudouridine38-40 synthase
MLKRVNSWKLIIEYDGSRYSGWAEQTNARTVMGELRKAVEIYLGARAEIGGSGRTDAGVHAAAQVAHVRAGVKRPIAPEQFLRTVNDELPYDIAVLSLDEAPDSFHARHDAIARRYVYQISTRKDAFSKKYVWWIKEALDVEAMKRAAAMAAGRHNFIRFRAKDIARPGESTIVEVHTSEIALQDSLILYRIEGSHFLWRMVRRLAGSIVKVGRGELTVEQFEQLLANRGPALDVAAWTAPASGLFLEAVTYPAPPAIPGAGAAAADALNDRKRRPRPGRRVHVHRPARLSSG